MKRFALLLTVAIMLTVILTACADTTTATVATTPTTSPTVQTTTSTTNAPTTTTVPTSAPTITTTAPPDANLTARVNWLRRNAIAFDTTKPDAPTSDLQPLKKLIAPDTRLVALGEATHGTHEFFEMKDRMLRFLVQEQNFTAFGIEASWSEANLVNNYVQTGQGDPQQLLIGLGFWTWDAQEVLDLIKWMRAYNADPANAAKPRLQFVGFDMQAPKLPVSEVKSYVQKVDPAQATQFADWYKCLTAYLNLPHDYTKAPDVVKRQCRQDVQSAYDNLNARQSQYVAASSQKEFDFALQAARIVLQAETEFAPTDEKASTAARDVAMADNVSWWLNQLGPDSKMVIWAHNGHVNTANYGGFNSDVKTMGHYLRDKYGSKMTVFGFNFYQGSFYAIDGINKKLNAHSVQTPPANSYEAFFAQANLPRMFVDLRGLKAGEPVADWFLQPRPYRHIGSAYYDNLPQSGLLIQALPTAFDVIIYLQDTTPSRLLPAVNATPVSVTPTQTTNVSQYPQSPINLDFENGGNGWYLSGSAPQDYNWSADVTTAHTGQAAGTIKGQSGADGFGNVLQAFQGNSYRGTRIQVSAYIKTASVAKSAQMWVRVDPNQQSFNFDNMDDRPIIGTTDWQKYSIVVDVPDDTQDVTFGLLLFGEGQAWIDDFQFEVVGSDVPKTGPYQKN